LHAALAEAAQALCRAARRGSGNELRRLRLGERALSGGVVRLDWPARRALVRHGFKPAGRPATEQRC